MDVRANEREGKRADRIVNSSARGRKGKQTGRAAHWKGFREKGVSLLPLYPLSLARSVCVCVFTCVYGEGVRSVFFFARARARHCIGRGTQCGIVVCAARARELSALCAKRRMKFTRKQVMRGRERERESVCVCEWLKQKCMCLLSDWGILRELLPQFLSTRGVSMWRQMRIAKARRLDEKIIHTWGAKFLFKLYFLIQFLVFCTVGLG